MMVAEKMWIHWLHVLFFFFVTVHIYLGLVSWQDLSYFCEGLSQSIGGIHMPLLHTVLKMYSYWLHYLCAHLSIYLDRVHLTTPEWFFHPYLLQIPYARSFYFSATCLLARNLVERKSVKSQVVTQDLGTDCATWRRAVILDWDIDIRQSAHSVVLQWGESSRDLRIDILAIYPQGREFWLALDFL